MKKSPIKSFEHGFKRLFTLIFQMMLKKGGPGDLGINPEEIQKVLFLRPDKLGDMVVSLPVFYNLKRAYPHLELYLVSSRRNDIIV